MFNSTVVEQDELEKEKNLWNLICLLFSDEQDTKKKEGENDLDMELENFEGLSEVAIVENLEKGNPFLRRIKLVIQWLEKIAAESNHLKLIKERMSAFPEKCSNWEHTLHHLSIMNTASIGIKEKFSGRDFINELVKFKKIIGKLF